jgi:drug/metabolite transporter (DMT)-like permease
LALSPNTRGSLAMVGSMAGFTINDALTKLVSLEMNFGQVMLLRGCFAIVLIGLLTWSRDALRPVKTLLQVPILLRAVGEAGGTVSFLMAITHLPLANTSAIFQAMPFTVTLGAALVFGEQVGWRRWIAIAIGFVGVLIVVQPGSAGFNEFSIFALISVAFCTLRDLATKRIASDIPTLFVTMATTVIIAIVGGLIIAPLGGWTPPSTRALALLAAAAVVLLVGYQCAILAVRLGEISVVAPYRYTALPWAMLLGYLVFGDVPDPAMIAGAAIIVSSGLYMFYRESLRSRSARLAADASGVPPEGL